MREGKNTIPHACWNDVVSMYFIFKKTIFSAIHHFIKLLFLFHLFLIIFCLVFVLLIFLANFDFFFKISFNLVYDCIQIVPQYWHLLQFSHWILNLCIFGQIDPKSQYFSSITPLINSIRPLNFSTTFILVIDPLICFFINFVSNWI